MRRATSRDRVLLGALAGTFTAAAVSSAVPVAFFTIAFRDGASSTVGPVEHFVRFVTTTVGFMPATAFLSFGILLVLFTPLWAAHHRAKGGMVSFLLLSAVVGALPLALISWLANALLWSFARQAEGTEAPQDLIWLMSGFGAVVGLLAGLAIWLVAYGNPRGRPPIHAPPA